MWNHTTNFSHFNTFLIDCASYMNVLLLHIFTVLNHTVRCIKYLQIHIKHEIRLKNKILPENTHRFETNQISTYYRHNPTWYNSTQGWCLWNLLRGLKSLWRVSRSMSTLATCSNKFYIGSQHFIKNELSLDISTSNLEG